MRTALRSGCLGLMAAAMLMGCPGTTPPMINPDTGPRDSGSTPDTGVLTPDTGGVDGGGIRPDTGGGGMGCSSGGGCDLLSPTSCPDDMGTRQACYPSNMGMTVCAPAGAVGDGGACMNLNDCDTGLLCLSTGTCAAACCSNSDCDLGATCRPLTGAGGMVGVCIRPTSCTPVPNTGCTGGQCVVTAADGSTDCAPIGTSVEGANCDATPCLEGLGCYGVGGVFTCQRLCRLGSDADCTGGGACTASGLGDVYGLCQGG